MEAFIHTDRIKCQYEPNLLPSCPHTLRPRAVDFTAARKSKFSLFASGVRFPDRCELPLKIKLVSTP